ncbi:alginate lyase family protein [Vibrio splendidus]|uniref:alginate lyase family protein n=1 Tax=Vibrio splendidus TaxID=29497 RepID=UPI000D379F36|nr:alginate lyase family protein [Vibrio splendidus]PTO58113.1 heparinase [Vibrio splendidus]
MKIFRLYQTVSCLKLSQVFYRLYYRYFKLKLFDYHEAKIKLSGFNSDLSLPRRTYIGSEIVKGNSATFLNETRDISSIDVWNDKTIPKLWLYNLHYLDFLNSENKNLTLSEAKKYLERWILENAHGKGNGWEPYTLSLRVVNIVKFLSANTIDDNHIQTSLYVQVNALSKQIEYHILANHIFANAKALIFSGVYFNKYGQEFLDLGLEIMDRELEEQFNSDGAHFELSPMYHSILVWDLLEIIELTRRSNNPYLLSRLELYEATCISGIIWLENIVHTDGSIPLFNDSAHGIAPTLDQIISFARCLSVYTDFNFNFDSRNTSGLSSCCIGECKLILNHANIEPSYQPGHAHADTFSFEVSLFGVCLIVNSGVSQYGVSKQRLIERSTSSHNTLVYKNINSSDVWSGFRVGARAKVFDINYSQSANSYHFMASHDGYCRINKGCVHTRTWDLNNENLTVKDILRKSDKGDAEIHYHFHPDITLRVVSKYQIDCVFKNNTITSISIGNGSFEILDYKYKSGFGLSIDAFKVVIYPIDVDAETTFSLRLNND